VQRRTAGGLAIHYRTDEQSRLAVLRDFGLKAIPALPLCAQAWHGPVT
jgi:hypothetical protein